MLVVAEVRLYILILGATATGMFREQGKYGDETHHKPEIRHSLSIDLARSSFSLQCYRLLHLEWVLLLWIVRLWERCRDGGIGVLHIITRAVQGRHHGAPPQVISVVVGKITKLDPILFDTYCPILYSCSNKYITAGKAQFSQRKPCCACSDTFRFRRLTFSIGGSPSIFLVALINSIVSNSNGYR